MTAILIFWFLCGIASAVIASAKGKNPVMWGALGFVLGVFGLIIICAIPAEKQA